MKRILCTSIVLIMLLTACSAPAQQVPPNTEPSGSYTYGVYELNFDVERLSGWPFESFRLFSRPLVAFSEAICKAMRGITLFPTMKPLD